MILKCFFLFGQKAFCLVLSYIDQVSQGLPVYKPWSTSDNRLCTDSNELLEMFEKVQSASFTSNFTQLYCI